MKEVKISTILKNAIKIQQSDPSLKRRKAAHEIVLVLEDMPQNETISLMELKEAILEIGYIFNPADLGF